MSDLEDILKEVPPTVVAETAATVIENVVEKVAHVEISQETHADIVNLCNFLARHGDDVGKLAQKILKGVLK